MTEPKFTKGDWTIETTEMGICGGFYRLKNSIVSESERKRICYCETDDENNAEEIKANFRLIATVKKMYKTLQAVYWILDREGYYTAKNEIENLLREAGGDLNHNKDIKKTRFDRLASSVDEMAEALVSEFGFGYLVLGDYFRTNGEAVAAAKEWLLEVEE